MVSLGLKSRLHEKGIDHSRRGWNHLLHGLSFADRHAYAAVRPSHPVLKNLPGMVWALRSFNLPAPNGNVPARIPPGKAWRLCSVIAKASTKRAMPADCFPLGPWFLLPISRSGLTIARSMKRSRTRHLFRKRAFKIFIAQYRIGFQSKVCDWHMILLCQVFEIACQFSDQQCRICTAPREAWTVLLSGSRKILEVSALQRGRAKVQAYSLRIYRSGILLIYLAF
jgi:hypothetical protein